MNSEALFEGCRAGDDAAWRQLFRERSPQIYRWAVFLGLRPPEAEDAAQEVLVIAHRRFDKVRAAAALDAWLYQTTRRVVANIRRRNWWTRVRTHAEPPEPAFDAPRRDIDAEISVRACFARLSHKQAEVLMLSEVEGHTREEIAQMLGVAPGTVASRLRLARTSFSREWTRVAPNASSPRLTLENS